MYAFAVCWPGKLTFDLSNRAQVLLESIVKLRICHWLKVAGVNTARRCGVAAFAHACVVAQSTLVQVRVGQGILSWDPLWLETQQTYGIIWTRLAWFDFFFSFILKWTDSALFFFCSSVSFTLMHVRQHNKNGSDTVSNTNRIKHQHPAEEVDSFMGCLARQCVQNR